METVFLPHHLSSEKKNQNINSPYVFLHISTQVTSENLAVDKENISICATE